MLFKFEMNKEIYDMNGSNFLRIGVFMLIALEGHISWQQKHLIHFL